MKTTRFLFTIMLAVAFAVSTNGQTVVRSLDGDNPNQPKEEQKKQQDNQTKQDNNNQYNPNQYQKQNTVRNYHDEFTFWGFGAGYVYSFPVVDGSASDGQHGVRVPLYLNYVFKNAPVGIYGLFGYQYNKSTSGKNSVETHRLPLLLHVSYNVGNDKVCWFFHGGPGLNILAGGKVKYEGEKTSVKSHCDFTMGLGIGMRIKKSLMFHVGFNGALTGDNKTHVCDVDASIHLTF